VYTLREEESPEKVGSTSHIRRNIILLDSSILMYAVKGKKRLPVNIEEALRDVSEGSELAILSSTVKELETLKKRAKGKTRIAADFALEFIKKLKIPVIEVPNEVLEEVLKEKRRGKIRDIHDEILLRMAKKLGAAVATNDFELVKKLRKRNITCYYLSGRNWVTISGYLD